MTTNIPIHTIEPSVPHAHTHTVVFLHGRAGSAERLAASLADSLDSRSLSLPETLPSFRWVFPQAPLRRCATHPATTLRQWFDVRDPRDFSRDEELQADGLRDVVPALRRILADEAAALSGRWDRLVLAGFSMGAATAAHLLFNLDAPRLGAFLGFSGRCPFAGRTLAGVRRVLDLDGTPDHDSVLRATPVLLEHCVDDRAVPVENARALREALRRFGARVEWREYPDGGHWLNSPAGMDDAVDFLTRHVVHVSGP